MRATKAKICRKNSKQGHIGCIFWPSFRCCVHPKAGQNTFCYFQPFLLILHDRSYFSSENKKKLLKKHCFKITPYLFFIQILRVSSLNFFHLFGLFHQFLEIFFGGWKSLSITQKLWKWGPLKKGQTMLKQVTF